MANSETIPPPRKRYRLLRIILFSLLGLFILLFFAIFFGLNYFGERFLRDFMKEKIHTVSQGLYDADFGKITLNIFNGKVTIHDFLLSPDTQLYEKLKAEGKIKKSLYQLSYKLLSIDHLNFWQIYTQRQVSIHHLLLVEPQIGIAGFPDSAIIKRNRIKTIYDDIYPMVSTILTDFHIDSVTIVHGFMLSEFRRKTGQLTQGEYEFSAVLRDLSVNRFSYYNHSRVFYSRDIKWVIHNFEYSLADSLYFIKAEEAGFSLSQSRLYGKKFSLRPNFKSRRLKNVKSGDFFQVDLPEFSIDGINLYKALVDKEVEVNKVELSDFTFKIFRNYHKPQPGQVSKKKKPIRIADLYTVISKELRSVSIDSISIKRSRVEYYGSLQDPNPEMKISEVNLDLFDFYLDSLASHDLSKIFYAKNIELALHGFTLVLRDEVHSINADDILFSTRKSFIQVNGAIIYPNREKNIGLKGRQKNTFHFLLPQLTFKHIDLRKVFNHRILDFNELQILEPELKYTRFREPVNKDPHFKQPKDFFEEENEEVIYDLLKKYLRMIKGNFIRISNGYIQIAHHLEEEDKPVASGSFDLIMQGFRIDSLHGLNQEGFFYSRDFELDLQALKYNSPDNLYHFQADRVHIATPDSMIDATNVSFFKTVGPLHVETANDKLQSLTIDFFLNRLHLTGLDPKRLFLEKVLKANLIILENPSLRTKTENNPIPEGPTEFSNLRSPRDFIRSFEISRLMVKKGSFSYDGYEDRRASYFSLKDIDFALLNAMVKIPIKDVTPGMIRFDSLQLSVFPFRAVLSDSTYALQCQSLVVHSYPARICLRDMQLMPLKKWDHLKNRNNLITASIPELEFTGFYFDKAIFDHEWLLDKIRIVQPEISMETRDVKRKSEGFENQEYPGSIILPPFIKKLSINSISIDKARGTVQHWKGDTVKKYSLHGVQMDISKILVDSITQANPDAAKLFNAENIRFRAQGFSRPSHDSMYTFSSSGFGFSLSDRHLFFDTVKLTPNYEKYQFAPRLGYQTDRLMINIPRIDFYRVDFRRAIIDRTLVAGLIQLHDFHFEAFRDKRVPFPEDQRPLMPAQAVAKIPIPTMIDTIDILNGFAAYEEQTGDEPGRIYFNRMNATLTGVTNIDGKNLKNNPAPTGNKTMELHGTAYLMGEALVEAWFHFPLNIPNDTFSFKATVGPLNLRDINPMLSKLMPVSIRNGVANQTVIKHVNANNDFSRGFMVLQFNNLNVKVHADKSDFWDRWGSALLTGVANLLLDDGDSGEKGKLRSGVIYFERDKSKGFFNFIWKSTLSGIKSSAGINTKKQREIRRFEKKQTK